MSPEIAVMFWLPVVVKPLPIIVQSPAAVVRLICPEPVAPVTVAPVSSVMFTSPVPVPVKTKFVASVRKRFVGSALAPMSPSAPPAVSVTVLPATTAAALPACRSKSPALAVIVTFPVVETPVELTVQSPDELMSVMLPLPVEPLTFAPFASVMSTSPVPLPAKTIEVAVVIIGLVPPTPMSPSRPPAVSVTTFAAMFAKMPVR